MRYTITPNNIHLIDSYKISKKNFQKELNQIRGLHPNCEVWKRKDCSLKLEWSTHNFLYMLHIYRSHTKDCDLNADQSFFIRAIYAICGAVAWVFIS